jgi:acyl carrier protein
MREGSLTRCDPAIAEWEPTRSDGRGGTREGAVARFFNETGGGSWRGTLVMDALMFEAIASAIRSVSKRTQTMAITADSLLVEDLALDSLDLVGVLMKLEDHFALKIELDEVPNILTVSDLAGHLMKLVGDRSAAA